MRAFGFVALVALGLGLSCEGRGRVFVKTMVVFFVFGFTCSAGE